MNLKEQLQNILTTIDSNNNSLDEFDVSSQIKQLINKHNQEAEGRTSTPHECISEEMAFDFNENHSDKGSGWGTYFGPIHVFPNADGTVTEYPSIQAITPEVISYWENRCNDASHPVLKARYLGLIWDFKEKVTNEKPNYQIAQNYIDSLNEIAKHKLQLHSHCIRTKLERAIELSLKLRDKSRLEESRIITLEYYQSIVNIQDHGSWSFAYDILLDNKKTLTTDDQEKEIIETLEKMLASIENSDLVDPWQFESGAMPLARYYHLNNKPDDLKRVITLWGAAFENASEKVDPMLASSWLQHILQIYINYGFVSDKKRVLIRLRELGPKVDENLKAVSVEKQIPIDELNKFIEGFVERDLNFALVNIAVHFIPNREKIRQQVHELSQRNALTYLVTRQLQDYKGRVVATVGNVSEHLDQHLILQLSQNMQFEQMFLNKIFEKVVEKFDLTASDLTDYFFQSPLFATEKRVILQRGVEAYIKKDYLVCTHLIVPQIEDIIRNLFEISGISILKPNKEGGFDLMTLGSLIREPVFQEFFSDLGENIAFYLQVLLTNNRGWNLRDNLCHGLIPSDSFDQRYAERAIHVLLCLSLIRPNDDEYTE